MIVIRKGEWFDSEVLMELRMAYHAEEAARDQRFAITEPRMVAVMALRTMEMLLDPTKTVLLAVQDGVVVGYLMVDEVDFVGFHSRVGAAATGLYLKPEVRRSNVGFRLIRMAKTIAVRAGYPRSQAVVLSENKAMHNMMCAFGYEPIAVVYQKDLAHGKPNVRPEAVEQVHEESGVDASGGAGRPEPEPALSSGAAACSGIPAKSEFVQS